MKTVEEIRKTYPDFKSPQELGITDEEYCALNEVREGLCEGRYVHDIHRDYFYPNGFNMKVSYEEFGCGTIACIGGWMFHLMSGDTGYTQGSVAGATSLNRLFYPDYQEHAWDTLTPKQAALACANFLKGNTWRPWDGV